MISDRRIPNHARGKEIVIAVTDEGVSRARIRQRQPPWRGAGANVLLTTQPIDLGHSSGTAVLFDFEQPSRFLIRERCSGRRKPRQSIDIARSKHIARRSRNKPDLLSRMEGDCGWTGRSRLRRGFGSHRNSPARGRAYGSIELSTLEYQNRRVDQRCIAAFDFRSDCACPAEAVGASLDGCSFDFFGNQQCATAINSVSALRSSRSRHVRRPIPT